MNQELLTASTEAILEMLKKYNNLLSKHQMEAESKLADWADYLARKGFTVKQVGQALADLDSKTFMPSSFEVATKIKESMKKKISSYELEQEILTFVRANAYDLEANYFHTLSEPARKVINAMGGTKEIRESNPDFIGRKLMKAYEDIQDHYESIPTEYKGINHNAFKAAPVDFANIARLVAPIEESHYQDEQ